MPKGIMKKMLVTTVVVMLCFSVAEILYQGVFLHFIYKNASIKSLQESFDHYVKQISLQSDDIVKGTANTSSYSSSVGAPLLIISSDLTIANPDFFDAFTILTTNTDVTERKYLIINDSTNFSIPYNTLIKGVKISFSGIALGNSDYLVPIQVKVKKESYYNTEALANCKNRKGYVSSLISRTGYVNNISNYLSGTSYSYSSINYKSKVLYETLLNEYLDNGDLSGYLKNESKIFLNDVRTSNNYVLLSKSASFDNPYKSADAPAEKMTYYFLTLQTVDDVSRVYNFISSYNIFLFIGFLVIAFVMCLTFTRWLTGPILYLNENAKKIANLDFTTEIKLNTNDELQELGESLNTMAVSLKSTFNQLEEKNQQLMAESQNRYNSEKRIRQLLTTVSHEFKTPLSLISSAASIVKDGVYEKDPSYYLDTINDQVEKLNEMINEVIDLSKLESGYFNLEVVSFNINDIISKMPNLFFKQLNDKDLSLSIESEDCIALGDKKKIEQVILNLISNAVRYSPNGSCINLKVTKSPERTILFELMNDGTLDEIETSKVWTRYYKSVHQEQIFSRGTGLGLEISARILDLHNSVYGTKLQSGKIIFYFTLPCVTD